MSFKLSPRRPPVLVALLASALTLGACGAGSLGSSGDEGGGNKVTLSFLVDSTDATVSLANGLVKDFSAENPDITITVETRPQGAEGDNLVKTRLATGDMNDVFMYNTGSLFQAINPQQNLVPLTGEPYLGNISDVFLSTVTAADSPYGVPFGSAMGGGVLYNKKVYERLNLSIPQTWSDFMANNAKIKAAGVAPVIQTYQETWTSQLFVLGDFHNVATADPSWAEKYTANKIKYSQEPAVKGFEHLQAVHDAGYLNKDFASAKLDDGLRMVADGEGAHYPMLTFTIGTIAANFPDKIADVGFFALPGDDASQYGLTLWTAAGVYIPKTTEGPKLDAAKKFLTFIASTKGCDAQTKALPPPGPYQVNGCTLPDDVPGAVKDLVPFLEPGGKATPALEFQSPVKGPALEQITVEVGSGIRKAKDGAALYDKDVEKQAQQLGLEGW
jgi:raffinose/stachyose/melibiose transport system substrate-binding protein